MSVFLQRSVAGGLPRKGRQMILILSATILLTPHIQKQFVYTRMSLKSELCIRAGSAHNLTVVEAAPEGDVGLEVDDDAEVEQDEADHQVLVDSQAGTAQ